METEKEPKKEESEKKQNKLLRRIVKIVIIFLAVMLLIFLIIVITLFVMYKNGKKSLYAKAKNKAPVGISSQEDIETAKEKLNFSTLQWQSDWIAYDGKVYEYNKDVINLLFLGIDRAGGLSQQADYGNWDAGQADAIFILSLDPTQNSMKIVAIPRNSMVDLNIYDADGNVNERIYNQICLQYGFAGGGKNSLSEMKRVVSKLLYELPIHGVCAIGYDAIAMINDSIGGVEVEVLEDIIYDPQMVKGNVIHLTGEQAYLYLQYRDPATVGSPTQRLLRQKQYLTGFVQTAKAKVKKKPLIVSDLYKALTKYMNTDISSDEAVYLAAEVKDYQFGTSAIYVIEGEDKVIPYINEDGEEDFYDDYYLNEESIKKIMVEVFYSEVVLTSDC